MNISSRHSISNFAHYKDIYCVTNFAKVSICGGWFLCVVSYYIYIYIFYNLHLEKLSMDNNMVRKFELECLLLILIYFN